MEGNYRRLQKTEAYDDYLHNLGVLEEHHEELRRTTDHIERKLYDLESNLPQRPLKKIYDRIRQDPTWYLQKQLIQGCIANGGCCSRRCRCCEHRHLNSVRRNGIGHCTIRCGCCASHRGFRYTEEEKTDIREDLYDSLFSLNPAYLLTMTEAYFAMPGSFGPRGFSIKSNVGWHLKQLKSVFKNYFEVSMKLVYEDVARGLRA